MKHFFLGFGLDVKKLESVIKSLVEDCLEYCSILLLIAFHWASMEAHFAIADDSRKDIVEIMSYSAGQCAMASISVGLDAILSPRRFFSCSARIFSVMSTRYFHCTKYFAGNGHKNLEPPDRLTQSVNSSSLLR